MALERVNQPSGERAVDAAARGKGGCPANRRLTGRQVQPTLWEGPVSVVGEAHDHRRRAARLPDPTLPPSKTYTYKL
jgi:hypothetical protein